MNPATAHVYEVRPRKDHRGVNVISDVLPFGRLWYAVIRVYDEAGNVIETHEHIWRLQTAVSAASGR